MIFSKYMDLYKLSNTFRLTYYTTRKVEPNPVDRAISPAHDCQLCPAKMVFFMAYDCESVIGEACWIKMTGYWLHLSRVFHLVFKDLHRIVVHKHVKIS